MNTVEITLYLVGVDADDAQVNFPFDSIESAQSYCIDNAGMLIFEISGRLDLDTIRPVDTR